MAMRDLVQDLLAFVDLSPTPYHAVAEAAVRLEAAGFIRLTEAELWDHGPGACRYVVRNDGSLMAFQVGMHGVPPTPGIVGKPPTLGSDSQGRNSIGTPRIEKTIVEG